MVGRQQHWHGHNADERCLRVAWYVWRRDRGLDAGLGLSGRCRNRSRDFRSLRINKLRSYQKRLIAEWGDVVASLSDADALNTRCGHVRRGNVAALEFSEPSGDRLLNFLECPHFDLVNVLSRDAELFA